MSTVLEVSQPLPILCDRKKFIQDEGTKCFWEDHPEFAKKQGCYAFALKVGKGYTPWYVGRTRNCFEKECFTSDKLKKYHEALHPKDRTRRGTPVLFFIAPPSGKNVVPTVILKEVETFLIQTGYYANRDLINVAHKHVKDWSIKGVVRGRRGQPPNEAKVFVKMMDLRLHASGAVRKCRD